MDKPPALPAFKIHDLYLAAAVSYVCDAVPAMRASDRGLISFSFTQSKEVLEAARSFADGLLEINALGFSNRIKQIRGDMLMHRKIAKTILEEVRHDGE